jgi:hypothetical protein
VATEESNPVVAGISQSMKRLQAVIPTIETLAAIADEASEESNPAVAGISQSMKRLQAVIPAIETLAAISDSGYRRTESCCSRDR